MSCYFQHLATRRKTPRWATHVLIFAVGFLCRAGKGAYQSVREELHLPSPEVLRRVTRKIDTSPGINQTAVSSFMSQSHPNGIVLGFDEIYFQAGLKLMRSRDTLITIGFTCFGSWDLNPATNHFIFVQPNQLSELECDPEIYIAVNSSKSQSSHQPEDEESTPPSAPSSSSQPTGLTLWCSDTEAQATLSNDDTQDTTTAKMALHFVLTSPSNNSAQGIGYIECRSVTWQLLRALLFKIIQACNMKRNQFIAQTQPPASSHGTSAEIPSPSLMSSGSRSSCLKKRSKKRKKRLITPTSFRESQSGEENESSQTTATPSVPFEASSDQTTAIPSVLSSEVSSDAWARFIRFTEKVGLEGVDFISLVPTPTIPWPLWINGPPPSIDVERRIVAIVFDGSSHARAMIRKISLERIGGYRSAVHPSQPAVEIIMIGDMIHLFKRYRNNMTRGRIMISPDEVELAHGVFPQFYILPLNLELYKELIDVDRQSILSISQISDAAVNLSPRTKQSFPLAKQLLAPRTQMIFQLLQDRALAQGDRPRAHLMRCAKTVSDFGWRLLCRTRSRWVLNTLDSRRQAARQLLQLRFEFMEWKRKNNAFYRVLISDDRRRGIMQSDFRFPKQRSDTLGFFDPTFEFDMKFTLAGLARLCFTLNEVCLRLLTTDAVESLFSTIRAVAGGGGQLNVASHRWATRKAYIVRLNLFGYLGSTVSRDQALATFIVNASPNATQSRPRIELELPSISAIESKEINDQERAIIRYISGWVLNSLLKNFRDEKLGTLLQCFVGKLIRPVTLFQNFIEMLVKRLHAVIARNPDHPEMLDTLIDYLRTSCTSEFTRHFSGFDDAVFEMILQKVSSMFVADRLRRKKIYGSKSFRNGLT